LTVRGDHEDPRFEYCPQLKEGFAPMKNKLLVALGTTACLLTLFMISAITLEAEPEFRPQTNMSALDGLADRFRAELEAGRGPQYDALLQSTESPQKELNESPDIELMYVDEQGRPRFYTLFNIDAARTVSTDKVWPGGGYGYSLSGSGTALGELGEWDGGGVLLTHQEFGGRVTQMDSPASTHYHSTHVAGTLVAGGVVANAKGMSYEANLAAYDWDSDRSEMATAAASGMQVSNHSYGYAGGWYWAGSYWIWYGDISISTTEDFWFGFYDYTEQNLDQIAYDAPYYTPVWAAGNERNDYGPAPGGGHYVWDPWAGEWIWSTDTRDPDGGADGYDCLIGHPIAKNVLSIGAVNDISGGYSVPGDVVMSAFSSWGPTDDGRIKPDVVANGVGLYSCDDAGNTSYLTIGGTSMASPNAAGSVNLLVEHYEDTHGADPLSSTMKAVVVQTADEAGPNPGPDYMFGWGLMNTLSAADLISEDASDPSLIVEDDLADGDTDTYYLASDGTSPLRLTVAWTDIPGNPAPQSLNPPDLMLVNDLDLRVEHLDTSTTYYPYVMNPAVPGDAATTGDNVRDNVEQIHLASPATGVYMVTVSHKGTLPGPQWYSLVASEKMTLDPPDITPPEVAVTRPPGNKPWCAGSTYRIDWTATDENGVASVDLYYSVDGGLNYLPIASGEPNDGSYFWLVPEVSTSNAVVKVIAYDPSMNEGEGVSDEFTIQPCSVPVELAGFEAVALPNGVLLRWSSTEAFGKSDFFVERSRNGAGGPYVRLNDEPLVGDGVGAFDYSYLDEEVVPGTLYHYRLEAIEWKGEDGVLFGPYPVVAEGRTAAYRLEQNVPNPFARSEGTEIRFSVAKPGIAEISIFDAAGRLVWTTELSAEVGENFVHWDGTDGEGRAVSGGLYFYRIKSGDFTAKKKMMVVTE